jgi:hypothetical protein
MSIFNNVDKNSDLTSLMRMDLPLSSKPLPMDPQLNSSKTFPKRKALEKFGVSSSVAAANNSSLNVSAVSNGKLD